MAYEPKVVRDRMVQITCKGCEKVYDIPVNNEDYNAWKDKVLIQQAMPYLNTDTRELLTSGICGTCFDKLWEE